MHKFKFFTKKLYKKFLFGNQITKFLEKKVHFHLSNKLD